jgi:uncharacterized protein (DUF924 family)
MTHTATISEILEFWFGNPQQEDTSYSQRRKIWFRKDPNFDQVVSDRFLATYQQAVAGDLDDWQESPLGTLALVLLFDQFPRNMFRGTPKAFATDSRALFLAKKAIAQGFDQAISAIQRLFFYLPFEHSENLADQHQSVALMQQLRDTDPDLDDVFDYAIRHRDVIERFGRFPHRNQILGRTSTPEEAEFLLQPGSSF